MSDAPNGQAERLSHADVGETDRIVLEELARRPHGDRLARLERRELLELPASLGRLAAELGRARAEIGDVRDELRAMREERRRDNTAAKRTARLIATGIVWALATAGANLAGPLGGAGRAPLPPPIVMPAPAPPPPAGHP